jgi:hypothetical protein
VNNSGSFFLVLQDIIPPLTHYLKVGPLFCLFVF